MVNLLQVSQILKIKNKQFLRFLPSVRQKVEFCIRIPILAVVSEKNDNLCK
jgi:hypothetical protein